MGTQSGMTEKAPHWTTLAKDSKLLVLLRNGEGSDLPE